MRTTSVFNTISRQIMGRTRCFLFTLLSFFVYAIGVQGQESPTNCDSEDIQFTVEVTDSECQSDGKIKITRSGDDVNNYINYYYSLISKEEDGFQILPIVSNDDVMTLTSIPAGLYNVIITATCAFDSEVQYRHTIRDVTVGGNYKLIKASFDQFHSTASFETCPSGEIALIVTGGLGEYTFQMEKAPEAENLTESVKLVPEKVVDTQRQITYYKFPRKDYHPGAYLIRVSDLKCYSSTVNFEIPTLTQLPNFQRLSSSSFYPNTQTPDCSVLNIYLEPNREYGKYNPNEKKLLEEGAFEISVTKAGEVPTTWKTLKLGNVRYSFDMSPYKIPDFYADNSVEVYIRRAGCTSSSMKYSTQVRKWYLPGPSLSHSCENYSYRISLWSDYDGNYCFPLTVKYYKGSKAEENLVDTEQIVNFNSDTFKRIPFEYDVTYHIVVSDNYGTIKEYTSFLQRTISTNPTDLPCKMAYIVSPYLNYQNCPGTRNSYEIYNMTTPDSPELVCEKPVGTSSCELAYNVPYRIKWKVEEYSDWIYYADINRTRDNYVYSFTLDENVYTSRIDFARGRIYCSKNIPIGTKWELREPGGIIIESGVTSSSTQYIYFQERHYQLGLYTVRIIDPCGQVYDLTYQNPGHYNFEDFGFKEEKECSMLRVLPKGTLTNKRIPITNTRFKIIDGPKGGYLSEYYQKEKAILLTVPGHYTLAMGYESFGDGNYLASTTFRFDPPLVSLSYAHTAAFACVGGTTIGNIYTKGQMGKTPYTYELWNADNTVKIAKPEDKTEEQWPELRGAEEVAFFEYGQSGEEYTVRIKDDCGNTFSQKLTIGDLTNMTIAGIEDEVVCNGEPIKLTCLPLENYSWIGPNGYTSTEQNPVIASATTNHTGVYIVTVTPSACGKSYKGSVKITVLPCYAPVNPILMNKSM